MSTTNINSYDPIHFLNFIPAEQQRQFTTKSKEPANFDMDGIRRQRTNTKIRQNLLGRLAVKGVLCQPGAAERKSIVKSVIVFEWDDTVCCTSFLAPNGVTPTS